jgi:putative SOS response-associated peptidase YedK
VKQPYNFGLADDAVFAFAGLWERWRDPADELIETFTILTTKPNSLVAGIHARMPAIVKPDDYEPFDARLMKKYPVSTRVNRADKDDEECAREVPLAGVVATLF